MREILFRGKRCDNLEWVEGYLLKECNYLTCSWNLGIEYKTDKFGKFAYDVAEIVPYTVGQFTGLTDKNGKKIFEGDILDHTIQAEVLTNRGVVIWDCENARWALQLNTMKPCFYMHNPKSVEVIGNIHDIPELLRGEEDGSV